MWSKWYREEYAAEPHGRCGVHIVLRKLTQTCRNSHLQVSRPSTHDACTYICTQMGGSHTNDALGAKKMDSNPPCAKQFDQSPRNLIFAHFFDIQMRPQPAKSQAAPFLFLKPRFLFKQCCISGIRSVWGYTKSGHVFVLLLGNQSLAPPQASWSRRRVW